MKDLQNLLTQVSIINKKNNEILDATGGRFNMFRLLGVNHYENMHSAILAEFFNPKGSHGLKGRFLEAFVSQLTLPDSFNDFNCDNAIVKTEAPTENGRIDIFIYDNNGRALIIENKIYAGDQWEQLKRYDHFANQNYGKLNYQIFYLTPMGSAPSENSGGGVNYAQISYADDIIKWLERCVNLSARFPLVRETIIQYINHLNKLTNQDMDKINQDELVKILSKKENIESAIKISENMAQVKYKIVSDMAKKVAEKFSLLYEVRNDAIGLTFFKREWRKGSGITFALDNGKTYYSIKTPEALVGKAIPKEKIEELFKEKDVSSFNPYGYGYVLDDNWIINSQLFTQMVDDTFAEKIIIPRLQKVLDYLELHPEIKNEL